MSIGPWSVWQNAGKITCGLGFAHTPDIWGDGNKVMEHVAQSASVGHVNSLTYVCQAAWAECEQERPLASRGK